MIVRSGPMTDGAPKSGVRAMPGGLAASAGAELGAAGLAVAKPTGLAGTGSASPAGRFVNILNSLHFPNATCGGTHDTAKQRARNRLCTNTYALLRDPTLPPNCGISHHSFAEN